MDRASVDDIIDLAEQAKRYLDKVTSIALNVTIREERQEERFADAMVYAARSNSFHAKNVIRLMQGQVALEKGEKVHEEA